MLIDDLYRLFNLFSIILFLTAAIVIFRQHKMPAVLLVLGVIAKFTPNAVLWYLLVPDNVYMTWKFKLINLLQPLGALMMAGSVLLLVWRLHSLANAKTKAS